MRSVIWYIVFLAFLATVVPGCGGGGTEGGPAAGDEELGEILFIETGELRAVRNTVVTLPRLGRRFGQQQIIWMEDEGTLVEKGDSVVRLEAGTILTTLEGRRAELEMAMADLNKMLVDQETQLANQARQVQSARQALQQAVIDTQRVRYESEARKRRARLQWERSAIALQKAEEKLEATRRVQEQELLIQKIRVAQTRAEIEEAEQALSSTILLAPASGMVVHVVRGRERRKVQVGDQLHPGSSIIQLPDMSRMKALTSINETDINKISLGDPVTVRLDAFPKISFLGHVTWISYICHRKSRDSDIKVFDVEVLLDETSPVLKPGMTVSCGFHEDGGGREEMAARQGGDDGAS